MRIHLIAWDNGVGLSRARTSREPPRPPESSSVTRPCPGHSVVSTRRPRPPRRRGCLRGRDVHVALVLSVRRADDDQVLVRHGRRVRHVVLQDAELFHHVVAPDDVGVRLLGRLLVDLTQHPPPRVGVGLLGDADGLGLTGRDLPGPQRLTRVRGGLDHLGGLQQPDRLTHADTGDVRQPVPRRAMPDAPPQVGLRDPTGRQHQTRGGQVLDPGEHLDQLEGVTPTHQVGIELVDQRRHRVSHVGGSPTHRSVPFTTPAGCHEPTLRRGCDSRAGPATTRSSCCAEVSRPVPDVIESRSGGPDGAPLQIVPNRGPGTRLGR